MKSFLFAVIAMIFMSAITYAQESNYKREGTNFTQVQPLKSSTDVQTMYTYTVKDTVYPIWITKNGRCYIIRTSKNGNQYKQYLNKEICLQICQELGIEYKE